MDIKQILLVQSPTPDCEAAVGMAETLARHDGARVAGICLFSDPSPTPAETYAVGEEAIGEVLEHQWASVKALTAPVESLFKKLLIDRGLSDGWAVGEIEEWRDSVVQRARLADLVVLGSAGATPDFQRLAEMLVLGSGTPCLIVPPVKRARYDFKRIVIAWNGSREAKRAMDDALPWLKRASAVAAVIIAEEATRWVDRAQAEVLTRHLARHDVNADIIRVDAHGRASGRVLLDQCKAFDADLLVMGAFGRSRAAELILGGATRTILPGASLPVLLSH